MKRLGRAGGLSYQSGMRGFARLRAAGVVPVLALVAALLAALVGGLAPRALPASSLDPALATYLAMGGKLADLCGGAAGGHGDAWCPCCDACHLLAAPAPAGVARQIRFRAAVAAAVSAAPAGPAARLRPCGSRAPPGGVA